MGYFQALGVMIIILLFSLGLFYWIRWVIKRTAPDLKYKLKKPKIEEDELRKLMKYAEANVDPARLKIFLLTHDYGVKRSDELVYLYKQVKEKMKGGVKI